MTAIERLREARAGGQYMSDVEEAILDLDDRLALLELSSERDALTSADADRGPTE